MKLHLSKAQIPPHLLRYFKPIGYKPKDLIDIPSLVSEALRQDGWWLRSAIVWCKRAPMPESTRDRPTTAHEMVYLFAKSGDTTYYTHPNKPGVRGEVPPPDYRWHDNATGERTAIEPEGWRTELMEDGKTKRWRRINLWEGHDYFYDQGAERVPSLPASEERYKHAFQRDKIAGDGYVKADAYDRVYGNPAGRNLWSYWLLSPDSFSEAHFATFPRELARRCISLGTSAYGCCAECQAPWARVVEREAGFTNGICNGCGASRSKHIQGPKSSMRPQVSLMNTGTTTMLEDGAVPCGASHTTGWQPTCTHSAPVQPCTVLDPFSGSGRTGVVARTLGRSYVGIELNPRYVEMSEKEIAHTQPALPGLAV